LTAIMATATSPRPSSMKQTRRRSLRSVSFYGGIQQSKGSMTQEVIIPEKILAGLALEVHQCPILEQEWVEKIFKHNPAASPEGSYMIWRPTLSSRVNSGVLDHHRGFTLIAISYVRLGEFLYKGNFRNLPDATMMVHSWHNLHIEHKLVWAVGGEGGYTCFPHRMWAPYRGAISTNFTPWNSTPMDLTLNRELFNDLDTFIRFCPELQHRLDPHRFDGCPPRESVYSLKLEHLRPHAVEKREDDPNALTDRLELIEIRRTQDKAIESLNALQSQRSQLREQGEKLTEEAEEILHEVARIEATLDCVIFDYSEAEKIATIKSKLQVVSTKLNEAKMLILKGCQIPDQRYRNCVIRAQEIKDRLVQLSIAQQKLTVS